MYKIPRIFLPYLTVYAVILAAACIMMLVCSPADSHLMLNAYHSEPFDRFLHYYTYLAEWPLYQIGVIVPLICMRWRWVAFYAVSGGIVAMIVYILKNTLVSPRPLLYFAENNIRPLPPLVKGEEILIYNSFPSGHSCTFFIMFTATALLLSDYYRKEKEQLPSAVRSAAMQQTILLGMLVLAVIGAYSRVYLSYHFLRDITAGSVVGVAVPLVVFCLLGKWIMRE